jgi:hypothetical protein
VSATDVLEDYITRLSRWGRWGEDDQFGALNLVGPEQVRAAAALVRGGRVISLAMPYDQSGPQRGGLRSNPQLITTATGTWGVEVRPNEIDALQPLHLVALVHMGLAFGEMFDLDDLAADCAADRRYAFMLAATPLPITGAVGSPVAAVAIK